jgi:hypothetical protein
MINVRSIRPSLARTLTNWRRRQSSFESLSSAELDAPHDGEVRQASNDLATGLSPS